MTVSLNQLSPSKSKKPRKRVGRGNGSGKGTYSGRGQKGQRSRSGGRSGLALKGLKPFIAQTPKKKGKPSFSKEKITVINLDVLEKKYKDGDVIEPKILWQDHLIKSPDQKIKILAKGKLTKKLKIKAHAFSKKAKEEIIKKKGEVIILD